MARGQEPRKPAKSRPNPLDAAKITYIDYKDTDLLRKFISDRGKIATDTQLRGSRPVFTQPKSALTPTAPQQRPSRP